MLITKFLLDFNLPLMFILVIIIQVLGLIVLMLFPKIVLWLPGLIYGK